MSSTCRGAQRHPDDFYATPSWATDAIIPKLGDLRERWILEPSAGDGSIVRRLLAAGADSSRMKAIEIDDDRADACSMLCPTFGKDFLDYQPPISTERVGLIVMNPPFCLAQEFIERALSHWLSPDGTCAVLLRLAFACSKKRAPFRAAHPFDVYPLASRPSFTGGSTDSADYAWFLFGKGHGGRFAVLEAGKPGGRS